MIVPYLDLKAQYANLRDEVAAALDRVGRNSSFILGEEVEEFEKEFAAFCGVEHCIAVNSGTSALHLALLALGLKPGDEVITTPNTFIATVEAILYVGARPVFVDIDPLTANLDATQIARAISPRTRAILPVHLYGLPAAMDLVLELASQHQVVVIEDACQAHGARYRGQVVGSLGSAAAFSFYPSKNLGGYGEGGALTTGEGAVAARARTLRSHGGVRRYAYDEVGYNYRMDGFQGAVLRIKLPRLAAWNARRAALAAIYRRILTGARLEMQEEGAAGDRVYHVFAVYADDRDAVRAQLEERGVHTAIHYPIPIHLQKGYEFLGYARGSFPHAERACARVFGLPIFPELTDQQVIYAAETLRAIVGER